MDYLGQVLAWFQGVSHLRINLKKCETISAREVNNIGSLTQVLNCMVEALPSSDYHLGVSLGSMNKDQIVWILVLHRVVKR